MATPPLYDSAFFTGIEDGSRVSAREVVPELMKLVHPQSVVDLGCGTGAWLSVFGEQGACELLGVDGDYVDRAALLIPADSFRAADLGKPLPPIGRRFDLAVSLEVAEHLPAECAETYLDNLTALSDIIAFSAAIPGQGGTHHVNEQWPQYWKRLFEARGFKLVDCLRHRVWDNRNVERWYRQNLLLYVQESRLRSDPALSKEYENHRNNILALVHPATYLAPSLRQLIRMFPPAVSRVWQRRRQRRSSS